jgi:hypothetical protein
MLGFMRGNDLGGGAIAPVDGRHSGLDAGNVFRKSAGNAITPDAPPGTIFDTYRTMPVYDRVREFSSEEADCLAQLAKAKQKNAKATKRAAEHHAKILTAEEKINRHGQRMIQREAEFEQKTQRYKGRTASFLQGQREGYARMGQGLQNSQIAADQAIQSLMASL